MKKNIIFIFLLVSLMGIISCNSEITDNVVPQNNDRAEEIANAAIWYEANKLGEMVTVRSLNTDIIHVTPNWKEAFRRQNKKYKVVEAAFIWERYVGYATKDSYEAYQSTKDVRYLTSKSRLVIRTNKENQEIDACIMILIPSKQYMENTNFSPYKNITYLDKKDFSGRVAYFSLNGEFIEGCVFIDGKVVNSFEIIDIPFKANTRCYRSEYAGQNCHEEPIYQTITQDHYVPQYDMEGVITSWDIVTDSYDVLIGTQNVCESIYTQYWDPNCGKKNHTY